MTIDPKKVRFAVLATLAAGLLAYAVRGSLELDAPRSGAAPAATAPARALAAPATVREVLTRGGAPRNLSRPPGKLLILHFWATWCPPCVEELPGLLAFSREIKRNPSVELLAVSVDGSWKTVDDWLKARKAEDLPIALDPKEQAARLFGTEKFPETYVISPSGEVLEHLKGPLDWSSPRLRRFLDELIRASGPTGTRSG